MIQPYNMRQYSLDLLKDLLVLILHTVRAGVLERRAQTINTKETPGSTSQRDGTKDRTADTLTTG